MECCETKNNKGCCKDLNKNQMKGGKSIMQIRKKTLMWIVIGILFLAVLFLTFKVSGDTSGVQATGQVAKAAASSASSGMVGGC